jgi:hypothetical protein
VAVAAVGHIRPGGPPSCCCPRGRTPTCAGRGRGNFTTAPVPPTEAIDDPARSAPPRDGQQFPGAGELTERRPEPALVLGAETGLGMGPGRDQ